MVEEHVAYSSPDFDGKVIGHTIVDEGTRGWCITTSGEVIIHEDQPIIIWSVERSPSSVQLRLIDNVDTGTIVLN